MAEDLSAPLTGRKARAARKPGLPRLSLVRRDVTPAPRSGIVPRAPFPLARTLFGLLAAFALFIVIWMLSVDDPEGGRPVAEAEITTAPVQNPVADIAATPAPSNSIISIGPEIPVAGGPQITTLGDDFANLPATDPSIPERNTFGAFPDLLETTDVGAVPRIGPNGVTPFAAYARASVTPASTDQPLIAIVVTGLGLNEQGTLSAIDRLPDNVTLAFAPYGRTLSTTVGAAQAGGHELLLQIPLEPFDYPDNDPGPETLLTGQTARANLEKLTWLMSRFGGYIGVMNHMGARFTSSPTDFAPIMEELGTRGLGYLDDGSSNRSVAPQLAGTNRVPFGRAAVDLDTNPSRAAILVALDRLMAEASANGTAIGVISALPISIDTITEWAATLPDRGMMLVPASALMQRPQ